VITLGAHCLRPRETSKSRFGQNLVKGVKAPTFSHRLEFRSRGVSTWRSAYHQGTNIGNVHLAYKTVMEEQAQRDLNEVSSAKGLLTSTLVCWVFYSINAAICLVNIFVRRSGFAENKAADRVFIHVDTDKSELLVNNRFEYVSVSRAQHDAQIYTNDGSKLSHSLSRESSQRTAVEVEQQPAEPKTEPVSLSGVRRSEEEEGHSLGIGLA
jgi:hypothetical protein